MDDGHRKMVVKYEWLDLLSEYKHSKNPGGHLPVESSRSLQHRSILGV